MKKLILLFVLFVHSTFAQTSFAIIPFTGTADVGVNDREAFVSGLYQGMTNSGRYRIVDRNLIEQVLKEQNFQLSDLTEQKKVIEFGKIAGAEKIITGKMFRYSSTQPAITFSVIDVSTSQVEFSKEITYNNYTFSNLSSFLVSQLIDKYPLVGKVLGKSGDVYIINIGLNQNIKNGTRIFVARNNVLKGDDGEILMEEYKRVGILEVTLADKARSQCKLRSLVESNVIIQKDDMISPDPIPERPALVSDKPFWPGYSKGELLLDDDMSKKQYLSVTSAMGETYKDGRLFINTTHLNSGHGYCYYPAPFDAVGDFVCEAEITFEKNTEKYNRVTFIFRNAGAYGEGNGYSLYFTNDGSYQMDYMRNGFLFPIIKFTSTPTLKRGTSKNILRVVAKGSKFDLYFNDQFLAAFEHEAIEKGGFGIWSGQGSHVSVDNIKIWNIK